MVFTDKYTGIYDAVGSLALKGPMSQVKGCGVQGESMPSPSLFSSQLCSQINTQTYDTVGSLSLM